MALVNKVREFLEAAEGREVDLKYIKSELNLDPNDPQVSANLRKIMSETLVKERIVKPSGRHDGVYKVIRQISPIRVFAPDRKDRPPFPLRFPRDSKTGQQITIAEHIMVREGDAIVIGGVKNKTKTLLCMLFTAENLDQSPVLMGNEYTIFTDNHWEPAPRFFSRMKRMGEWVTWTDKDGYDRFTLLPVHDDYAEHIVRDKINLIDWINLEGGELYNISKVLEGCKSAVGRGILVATVQKSESSGNPRGGQFVEDFADVLLLLDGYGEHEDDILMTVKVIKEQKGRLPSRTFVYRAVEGGTQIWNFHEVKKCPTCKGSGYSKGHVCDDCFGYKYVDMREE